MPQIPLDHLLIIGAGGFAREVAWLARTISPDMSITFVVNREEYLTAPVDGIDVVLLDEIEPSPNQGFVVGIGDPRARRDLASHCTARGLQSATLIHPAIDLSGANTIGEGSVLCSGVVITTGIRIGRHVHLNLNSTVGHDTVIGDFVTVAPGANVSGNVAIEREASIGTGASIINGVHGNPLVVGERAVVAAGACVTKPVEPDSLVAGVPAVRKR